MPESEIREALINANFPFTLLKVEDTSSGCGSSFSIVIVSEEFQGKRTLSRHRQVSTALKAEIEKMHAFSQTTYTPDEWKRLHPDAGPDSESSASPNSPSPDSKASPNA